MKRISKFIIILILIVGISFFCLKKIQPLAKSEKILFNTEWKITQYGDNVEGQMMCFTIEGNQKGLVIIDGGYKDQEDQYQFLMDKISKHNNTVDSWIVTHFDDDHGGEFVRIAKEENVVIHNVYVPDTPTDMELLIKNAPDEDDWSVYEEYLDMDLPQKVKVHSGDIFPMIGLKMEVLSSYEDWIDEKTDNLLNNGSIVLKLYGRQESFLFCADVQSKVIAEYLLENDREKLKSDYLQVAHHGNNNLGEEFYQLVSPKIAFFPAPDWLMENRDKVPWFTVEENRKVLEDLGATIVWHNTSPNEIIFK